MTDEQRAERTMRQIEARLPAPPRETTPERLEMTRILADVEQANGGRYDWPLLTWREPAEMPTAPQLAKDTWGANRELRIRLAQIGNNQFSEHGSYERFLDEKQKEAEVLADHIKPRPTDIGLEIGSGTGVHAKHMAARSRHLHSVDVSHGFRDLFLETTKGVSNISYAVRSFFPMFPDVAAGTADYCYSSAVFCHLNVYDVYLYLEEVSDKLKTGGRFYVNLQCADDGPTPFFLQFLEHYRRKGQFSPIPPAQMQFHSFPFFERAAAHFGMQAEKSRCIGGYADFLFRKG